MWGKDTWSFSPLDTQDLNIAAASISDGGVSSLGYTRNITFQTSALRARLECKTLDYPSNTSAWLETIDFTDKRKWNATNSPPNIDHGYKLLGVAAGGPRNGYFACCANETQGKSGDAVIGYWTNRVTDSSSSEQSKSSYFDSLQMTMTAKMILGRPFEKLYEPNGSDTKLFIWLEVPNLMMVECTPQIDRANASVVVELDTGIVYSYDILEPPQNATEAWTDKYFRHNTSIDYTGEMHTISDGNSVTDYVNTTTR